MNKISIGVLLSRLAKSGIIFFHEGSFDRPVLGARPINKPQRDYLTFCRTLDKVAIDRAISVGSLVLVHSDLRDKLLKQKDQLIFVENPDLAFCILANLFLPKLKHSLHEKSFIENGAVIGSNCHIGANAIVGGDVILGDDVHIAENVVLRHCSIGDGTQVFPGVKIGSPGLGSHRDSNGVWTHFPHFGRVDIGANVVIQDNAVIARGSLSDTVISDGVVIGPLTWIAHNVYVESNVFIGQSVTVAGSVSIKQGAIIWGNASIRDGLSVGRKSIVGMGSVVLRDIGDDVTAIGNPAREMS